ncbi:uncharacterized protein BDZ99DRAFT_567727 [Mytilinidion resinicola]|uniref:Uncharacterized protein n=1 Tax=Mytilinidion resinicola TaxID=574789 RepID=A0A6A6YZ53_9PEZI|nr:uncharacterized protein BDZ99DRAFT_567727 [Mytilinidion resinicola]KAF2814030.1 hypothetical protein BDZ99DRAFT_567727 [Mytilinidion resinicola]
MAASGFSAGQYVLVPLPDAPQLSWPGIVCTEDMVEMIPEDDRQQRKNGYELPVLLRRADTLGVVYATAETLKGLDPEDREVIAGMDEDRRVAYSEIFDDVRNVYYPDLAYWREILETSLIQQQWNGYASDDSVQLVEEVVAPRRRKQNPSVPQSRSVQAKKRKVNTPSPSPEKKDNSFYTWNLTSELGTAVSQRKHSDKVQSTPDEDLIQSLEDHSQTLELEPEPVDREWATFYIGKDEKEKFLVPYADVLKFDCFKEAIEDKDEGICVRRPAFRKIDPKSFDAVSEFISNGDFNPLFKQKPPEDRQETPEDQFVDDMPTQVDKIEAMTRCIRAWKVSSEIPFEEMMEMTLRKIKAFKESPEFTLCLSKLVFAEPISDLDADMQPEADKQLREYLISEIHDNIWPDISQASNVLDAFQQRPDLMSAVLERIREAKEPRREPYEEI